MTTDGDTRVNEQHLFDKDAPTERVFCGADTSTEERVSVCYYLEQRKNSDDVGTVCEECKVFAPKFAMKRAEDLAAEGKLREAAKYRRLYETLRKETGQDRCSD